MTEDIEQKLREWAVTYHCADFIQNDPVQFPHRYTSKQDIEISGLLTAIMSFGNRSQILKKADDLHTYMGASPYQYVLSRRWEKDFPAGERSSFYRMLSYADFHSYFRRLHTAYSEYDSLEDALQVYPGRPIEKLCSFLDVSSKSPQKKLNMFCVGWCGKVRRLISEFGKASTAVNWLFLWIRMSAVWHIYWN